MLTIVAFYYLAFISRINTSEFFSTCNFNFCVIETSCSVELSMQKIIISGPGLDRSSPEFLDENNVLYQLTVMCMTYGERRLV